MFLLIIAAGYGMGQLGLKLFRDDASVESAPKLSLEDVLGAKVVLSAEDKVLFAGQKDKGNALQMEGRYEEALKTAREMIKINPWSVDGHVLLANIGVQYFSSPLSQTKMLKDFQHKEIDQAVNVAYQLDPEHVDVTKLKARYHFSIALSAKKGGRVAVSQKSFELAHEFVDKTIAKSGVTAMLLLTKAKVYLAEDKYDVGLAKVEEALVADKEKLLGVEIHLLRAAVYSSKKDSKKTEKAFADALTIKTITAREKFLVLQNRFKYYQEKGELYEARLDLIEMQQLRPDITAIDTEIKAVEKLIEDAKNKPGAEE